ncbi:hypothetical protein Salpa_5865 [Sporomusa sp. KB1]|nr:hypothetical protein Salpa_5865 [Sporomusa sp. KB1]
MPRHTKKAFCEKESITEPILNNWIYNYGLPVIKIGRRVYIEEADFQDWLKSHTKTITLQKREPEQIALPRQLQGKGTGILGKLQLAR